MSPLGIDDHWWWLIAAALLGIFEIFIPGVFLAWIAAAAAMTGVIAALIPISLPFQLAIFGLLAIAAVYGGRRQYESNPLDTDDSRLNDRTARLIGQTVTVIGAIENGEGRVKVGDGVWTARGADTGVGSRVKIVGAEGAILIVTPTSLPSPESSEDR